MQNQNQKETNLDPIISLFEKNIPLSNDEKKKLAERVTFRKVKRRFMLLQEDNICKHYTFVVSGCFKMYKVDENENDWICEFSSFYTNKPSHLNIEALENTTIYR